MRGSSCTSMPRPWPVPWPNASAETAAAERVARSGVDVEAGSARREPPRSPGRGPRAPPHTRRGRGRPALRWKRSGSSPRSMKRRRRRSPAPRDRLRSTFARPGWACGRAAFGPVATIVSNAGFSKPASRRARVDRRGDFALGSAHAARPGGRGAATADSRTAPSRSMAISNASFAHARALRRRRRSARATAPRFLERGVEPLMASDRQMARLRYPTHRAPRRLRNRRQAAASVSSYDESTRTSSRSGHSDAVPRVRSIAATYRKSVMNSRRSAVRTTIAGAAGEVGEVQDVRHRR